MFVVAMIDVTIIFHVQCTVKDTSYAFCVASRYLSGMSKGMSAQDNAPREVKGSMVTLKVKRSNLIEESDEPFYFADFKDSNDESEVCSDVCIL